MRLGLVSRFPPVHCGVAEYSRMLSSALSGVAPGMEILVFSTFEAGRDPYVDGASSAIVIPSYDRGSESYEGLLDALARVGGVDVLHLQHEYGIYGPGTGILSAMLEARRAGLAKSLVATLHTVLHSAVAGGKAEFQRSVGELDAVIVHSFLQEFELQAQGADPERLWRIPHGTLINPYLGMPRQTLAKELGVPKSVLEGFLVVVPGFIREDKGIDVLLKALDSAPGSFKLLVAGEPASREAAMLARKAEERGALHLLERYLSSGEILKLVALADAIVLPYKDAPGTYSVSGILHLSMGGLKPIVGARVPRLIELYQFAPRLTVPPRSSSLLADKLAWLSENYDYAVAYMSSAYSYAARTQWYRMARRHVELYKAVVEGRTLPPPGIEPHTL